MEKIKAMLMKLTFEKLREWAGESIFERGRKYIKILTCFTGLKKALLPHGYQEVKDMLPRLIWVMA